MEKTKTKPSLDSFLESRPETRPIFDTKKDVVSLSDEDEIFLLQAPKSFNVKRLRGVELNLNGKTRIVQDDVKYNCVSACAENPEIVTVMTGCDTLKSVTPSGCIKISRYVKRKPVPHSSSRGSDSVKFPDQLRSRHPLFGSNYSNKVQLDVSVQERLNNASDRSNDRKEKNKTKKKKVKTSSPTEEREETIFQMLSDRASTKSTKRKRNDGNAESLINNILSGVSSGLAKAKKEKNHVGDENREQRITKKARSGFESSGDEFERSKSTKSSENNSNIVSSLLQQKLSSLHRKEKKKKQKMCEN